MRILGNTNILQNVLFVNAILKYFVGGSSCGFPRSGWQNGMAFIARDLYFQNHLWASLVRVNFGNEIAATPVFY
jgi:hypothetical protein